MQRRRGDDRTIGGAEAVTMSTAPEELSAEQGADRAFPRAEGRPRRFAGLLLVGVAGVVLLFLSPYVTLLPFVGSFPAEDLRESLPGAYFSRTLCLPADAPGTQRGTAPPAPALKVERGLDPIPEGLFENSSSLYFSERRGELLAIDRIDQEDANKLWMLETQQSVSRAHLTSFLQASNAHYPWCQAPPIDRGITEGYWAAKGAGVLHHWVHLYEGGLGGRGRAQYGYAIPWSVHALLARASSLGPTSFVRLSWLVFAACGLAYIALLLHLFRDHPRVAVAALLLKITFFTRIGAFALLLAPGYHWYRELVLLAVPAILRSSASRWAAVGPRRAAPRLLAAGASLLLCYLVEPTFFVVAAACALVALLWGHYEVIAATIRSHGRQLLVVLVLLAAASIAVAAMQLGNLSYVAQKLRGDDLVVPEAKYVTRTLAVCLASLGFLLVLKGRKQYILHGYFALVAILASLYYFITPDVFHFYKFAEYAVPAAVAAGAFVVDRYGERIGALIAVPRTWLAGAAAVGFVALAMTAAGNLRRTPLQWDHRIKDSFGQPYFKTASFTINGRVIRADMSGRLAEHLRDFPASTRFDFMVSPFDKYVTFLYDRTNGFGAPDLIGWLDSSRKLERASRWTARSDRPVLVLLDEATLDVDPRLGIQQSHAVLGQLHLASKLNQKGRLRASDLAAELLARCEVDQGPGGKKGWRLLRCGRGVVTPDPGGPPPRAR